MNEQPSFELKYEGKKQVLYARIPLYDEPKLSNSGRARIIASSDGWLPLGIDYDDGLPISVGFNVLIPKTPRARQ